jgi:hypothetical protein
MFGAGFELNVDVYFKSQGRPIIFDYSSGGTYEANFTLATLVDGISVTPSQNTTLSNSTNLNVTSSAIDNENNNNNNNNNNDTALLSSSLRSSKSAVAGVITPTTRNKRTLFDSSNNQAYMTTEKSEVPRHAEHRNNSSDEDDALLTQMLDKQEKATAASALTQKAKDQKSPPSKKIKSLVQSLFEDNETEEAAGVCTSGKEAVNQNENKKNSKVLQCVDIEIDIDDEDNSNGKAFIGGLGHKKKTTSFVNFVNNTLNISPPQKKGEMPTIGTSIYIEETDSEEE